MVTAPLSVFDVVPLAEGQTPEKAIEESLTLARRAEELGYRRLWYGEHHLNPGVIGYSPALLIGLAGAVTTRLRLGAGAVLAGQRTALSIAEEFSLLQAAYGDRIDLGLGRAALRGAQPQAGAKNQSTAAPPARSTEAASEDRVTENGLLLPAAPDLSHLFGSPRTAAASQLLLHEGAVVPGYGEFTDEVISLLEHTASVNGVPFAAATPPTQETPEIWILGSSRGESAEVAGQRGLRFGANYHVAPSNVTDAVQHFRDSFMPSRDLEAPYVIVSAEVLVAETEQEADRLAAGYAEWVHSIRAGRGAILYPHPASAAKNPLPKSETALVRDRVSTRFVGTAAQVAEQLRVLQQATGADELLISTTTHRAEDRLRSYELLAEHWKG